MKTPTAATSPLSSAPMNSATVSEKVVDLSKSARWDDVKVRVAPPRARIEPGTYFAASVELKRFKAFGRSNVELGFDVFAGDPGISSLLGRVPMFITLPKGRGPLAPNCRLATMLAMLGHVRRDHYRDEDLRVLRGKLWRVEVSDTQQDHTGKLEGTEIQPYSVVRRALARA